MTSCRACISWTRATSTPSCSSPASGSTASICSGPIGRTRRDQRWQARVADGFSLEHFTLDWARRKAVCPEGHESNEWVPRLDAAGTPSIFSRFSPTDGGPCPSRARCTRSQLTHPRRALAVRPRDRHEALQARRAFEPSEAFAREYARRAGVEGTLSQGIRRCGLRRSRYVGLAKTHLGHVLTAVALNFARLAEWLAGTPRARTRRSPFVRLMVSA